MAEMIYLDTYVLQQDMRVRLPKAILTNMDVEKGKTQFDIYLDSKNNSLMFNCCLKISICCTPGAFNEQHLITSRLQYLVGSVSNIRFCIVFIFQFV